MKTTIPDDQITFAGENSKSSYFRIGDSITVIMTRNSRNEAIWLCLTCISNDCQHAQSTERKFTPRKAVA